MIQSTYTVIVEWGDCDPASIVFFPNYLRWMDEATFHLFDDIGLGWKTLQQEYNSPGLPLVRIKTDFFAPAFLGDSLEVNSKIVKIRNSSIELEHIISRGADKIVSGWEKRVWSIGGSVVKDSIVVACIPDNIVAILEG